MKHTPGPWVVSCTGGEILAQDGELLAQLWDKFEEDFMNFEANARLIAAAPGLLEACEALVEYVDDKQSMEVLAAVEWARAAIAKARGEGE